MPSSWPGVCPGSGRIVPGRHPCGGAPSAGAEPARPDGSQAAISDVEVNSTRHETVIRSRQGHTGGSDTL